MGDSKVGILKLAMGDATGTKIFPITKELTIGRDAQNDIVIPNLNISRKHAKFYPDDKGNFWVEDNGSHNGTILNGRLARKEKLQEGDIISIADVDLNFGFAVESPVADPNKKITNEDLGVIACDSTTFIDLSELKKDTMEELRKQKPSITDPWKEK